jgi:atlastin
MASNKKHFPIVEIDPNDGKFHFDHEALQSVMKQAPGLPVSVITIAGTYRQGKSFLLNFIIRYLENISDPNWLENETNLDEGFKWAYTTNRITHGIHIWHKPYIVTHNGKKIAVILLDTQGTNDINSTMNDSIGIFANGLLASSHFIYNIKNLLGENHLHALKFFSEYGRIVKSTNDDGYKEKAFQVKKNQQKKSTITLIDII